MNMGKFTLAMESVKDKLRLIDFSLISEVRFGSKENPICYQMHRFTDITALCNTILNVAERCYFANIPFTLQVYF